MFATLFCHVRAKHEKKKGLVKDSSAARKVLVQTIITYVNNACVSFLAGGKMLLMTSSQTLSVRTIMPNSQFSNCIVNFKRIFLSNFWKTQMTRFVILRKFRLMVP